VINISVIQLWIAVATLLIGGVGATVGAVWTISNKIRDIETATDKKLKEARDHHEKQLKEAQAEGDLKRDRIYKRFDEYKTHLEQNFVRRDMCGLMHDATSKAVIRMTEEMAGMKIEMAALKEAVIKLQAVRA
jgi:uncharacterized oligopeptide transporter (OPT) family protein